MENRRAIFAFNKARYPGISPLLITLLGDDWSATYDADEGDDYESATADVARRDRVNKESAASGEREAGDGGALAPLNLLEPEHDRQRERKNNHAQHFVFFVHDKKVYATATRMRKSLVNTNSAEADAVAEADEHEDPKRGFISSLIFFGDHALSKVEHDELFDKKHTFEVRLLRD